MAPDKSVPLGKDLGSLRAFTVVRARFRGCRWSGLRRVVVPCLRLLWIFGRSLFFFVLRMQAGRSHNRLTEFLKRNFGAACAGRRFLWGAELGDESVSVSDDRLQILRLRRIILQSHANLADSRIDAHLDVNKYVFSP